MSFKPSRKETKEHRLCLPMPWKGNYYTINNDQISRGRRLFLVFWWIEYGCFFLRAGWSMKPDPEQPCLIYPDTCKIEGPHKHYGPSPGDYSQPAYTDGRPERKLSKW